MKNLPRQSLPFHKGATAHLGFSLPLQSFNGVQIGGFYGGEQTEDHADNRGKAEGDEGGTGGYSCGRTHDGGNEPGHDNAGEHTQHTAAAGENGGFGEKLI